MRAFKAFSLFLTLYYPLAGFSSPLSEKIEVFIQEKLPTAQVGIAIESPQSGDIIYHRQADQLYYPASSTKLFSAAAALKELGPSFQFKTLLLKDEKNIYLKFTGDPTLTENNLLTLVSKLKTEKPSVLNQDIIIDDSTFSGPYYGLGWTWDSLPWYYSAPVSAIIVNENKTILKILEGKKLGEKLQLQYDATLPKFTLKTNVVGVSKTAADKECQLHLTQKQSNLTLDGCWPIERTPASLSISIEDPKTMAKEAIETALKQNHIPFEGKILFAKANPKATLIATHDSPPLSEILKSALADSNNLTADAITKTLGLARRNEGSFLQGAHAIQIVLNEAFDFPADQYELFDGSGMSRYNLISPSLITELLYRMYHDPLFSVFHKAMSHAGKNGTLADRMKEAPLVGRIVAKTGSAKGTSALSGYLKANSGKIYIFSIVINQSLDKSANLKMIEDQFCEMLYNSL